MWWYELVTTNICGEVRLSSSHYDFESMCFETKHLFRISECITLYLKVRECIHRMSLELKIIGCFRIPNYRLTHFDKKCGAQWIKSVYFHFNDLIFLFHVHCSVLNWHFSNTIDSMICSTIFFLYTHGCGEYIFTYFLGHRLYVKFRNRTSKYIPNWTNEHTVCAVNTQSNKDFLQWFRQNFSFNRFFA